jgi:hypothetical protein
MSEFKISTAVLKQSADGLVGVVDRLAEALTQLETKLRGYGEPWGTGLIGPILGELYLDIHDLAMGSLEANAEVMSEFADGLDGMADDLAELEEQIESGLEYFGQQFADRFPGGTP